MPGYIYLLYEEKHRELTARRLIAHFLCAAGHQVVIGPQWVVIDNLHTLPPGVVLFKGNNRIQARGMAIAKRAGHRVASIEEEVFACSSETEVNREYDPQVPGVCDQFFAQGAFQQRCIIERFPGIGPRIVVVGNPRADLLRPAFRGPLQQRGAAIRQELGRFILMITNAASINFNFGDTLTCFERCADVGLIDAQSQEDFQDFQQWCDWQRVTLLETVRYVHAAHRRFPTMAIVVRPHPSEKFGFWQEMLGGLDRVEVIRRDEHLAWSLASELVVHGGSTVGLETFLLDQPTLSISSARHLWHGHFISNKVNPVFEDHRAAIAASQAVLEGNGQDTEPDQAHHSALADFLDVSEDLSAVRIAAELDRLQSSLPDYGQLGEIDPQRQISVPLSARHQAKAGVSRHDLERRACEIAEALGSSSRFTITEPIRLMFHCRPLI